MSWWPQVLREQPMRRLWLASAGTAVAVWCVQIAVTVEVLRGHSVATLAVIGLAGTVPSLLLLPLAGICADRYDTRRLSIAVLAAQAACLVLLALTMHRSLVVLAILYAAQGSLAAFWPPARQQWMYGLVAAEQRHEANSALGSINGIMTLLGAGLGGLLSAWNPAAAVVAAAVLQLATLVRLLGVPRPPAIPAETGRLARPGLVDDLVGAIRAARNLPLARSVVWIGVAWGLIGGGYNVLLAGHITKDLHRGPVALGLVYATDGLCVLLATTLAGKVPRSRHLAVYASAYIMQGLAWAAMFAAGTLPLAMLSLVIMRLASGYIIALDATILLETVPPQLRGRIASLHWTTYIAVARLSLSALGVALATFSIAAVGVTAGLASAGFGVVWWRKSGRPAIGLYLASGRDAAEHNDPLLESACP